MSSKNYNLYILSFLVLFQGLSGIIGGAGLISDPSGKTLGIPVNWLDGSSFPDYLIPGIILFAVLGIYPLIIFIGLLKKKEWAITGTRNLGFALLIWIIAEVLVIGYQPEPPLQAIYFALGLVIILMAYFPHLKSD